MINLNKETRKPYMPYTLNEKKPNLLQSSLIVPLLYTKQNEILFISVKLTRTRSAHLPSIKKKHSYYNI